MGKGEFVEEFGVSAIGFGDSEFREQSGESEVQDGMAFAAGLMGESTGDEGFADAGGSGDEHVEFIGDPLAGSELPDEGFIELSWGAVIAVARKLAVILPKMWMDDTDFRYGSAEGAT